MANSIRDKHFPTKPLLVFKSTGGKCPRGHVTDTECRPDITAAFDKDWEKDGTTLWPCIRLAGEKASKGKSRGDQEKQAISYLHYLLLARPDLHVAQGLLTSEDKLTFFLGIGGSGIRSFTIRWDYGGLSKLMYAFVYRLYEPGDFADGSYVDMVPNWQKNIATYTVRLVTATTTEAHGANAETTEYVYCPGLQPIYASRPFGGRTHILSNPDSAVTINSKPLKVVKDQLCRLGTRSDEHTILTRIHTPEKVPGVVEVVYHEFIEIPSAFHGSRERGKHRTGLQQLGHPFASIPTLRQMLEIVYDILEVLRYLRVKRNVLHRDVSQGNVLYMETRPTTSTPHAGSDKGCCFIKYLLGKSDDPQNTSALLIDFNHAEDLATKQEPHYTRLGRTGTPVFMARAVERGSAVPLRGISAVPAVPDSPEPYTLNHPDRIKKFPHTGLTVLFKASADSHSRRWTHELDHDSESVFWLLLFWVVGAQPTSCSAEAIESYTWAGLTESLATRVSFIEELARRESLVGVAHSVYKPLWPLLRALAAILVVDRHWLDEADTRNNPEYVSEAFQRLILTFVREKYAEEFMTHKVDSCRREVSVLPQVPSLTETIGQRRGAESSGK